MELDGRHDHAHTFRHRGRYRTMCGCGWESPPRWRFMASVELWGIHSDAWMRAAFFWLAAAPTPRYSPDAQ